MTYVIMTIADAFAALSVGVAVFVFLQCKAIDIRDRGIQQERAAAIQPGDEYVSDFGPPKPLEEVKQPTRYIVLQVKDGYVKWRYDFGGDPKVDSAYEFIKYKVKTPAAASPERTTQP